MQGGGSFGAYECGVYKALSKRGIKFDIIAGTSIGAINAAIIVGSKNDDEPATQLEDFWLNVAEKITPSVLPDSLRYMVSSIHASMYGNLKIFMPLWFTMPTPNESFFSYYRSPYPALQLYNGSI